MTDERRTMNEVIDDWTIVITLIETTDHNEYKPLVKWGPNHLTDD